MKVYERVNGTIAGKVAIKLHTDDPLAKKERVTAEDLAGRTLMIGGGSPPALKRVQQGRVPVAGIFERP